MDRALQEILINTYNVNADIRRQAEDALQQLLRTPNFLIAFIVVIEGYPVPIPDTVNVTSPSIHRDIRVAAAIVLKNKLRDIWMIPGTSNSVVSRVEYPVTDEEKEFCKVKLLEIILKEVDYSLKGLLVESIRTICDVDFPEKWPALIPTIIESLKSNTPLTLNNALLILRKIIKKYEFRNKDNRNIVDELVNQTVPYIQQLLQNLLYNNQIEAAMILKLCMKIFWSYTVYVLPIQSTVVDVPLWFQALSILLEKQLPEANENIEPYGQPTDTDERRKWPWWKLKKWVSRIMTHFLQRYGNPRYCDELYTSFAQAFRSQYSIQWLAPIFNTLRNKAAGKYITDDVYRNCIVFVSNCSEMSPPYKIIKQNLEFLLFNIAFPTICLRKDEIEMFDEDPAEFIQKNYNVMEDFVEPRAAVTSLVQTLARYRQKDVLPVLLPFIQSKLTEYNTASVQEKNYIFKDAVMVLIAWIFKILNESKTYSSLVEPFILHHVLIEFQSPIPYLRYRACWIVEYFRDIEFKTPGLLQQVTSGLLGGLRDKATPVQAASACSLQMMIESEETTELLRPLVKDIIGEYFRIMDEVETDAVLSALQSIIQKYGEEVKDISPLMVTHLLRLFEGYSNASKEDEDECFSAIQCLDTIISVIDVVQEHPLILGSIEVQIIPLILKILDDCDAGFEYLDSCIEMLSYFTYYSDKLSEGLWSLCIPIMISLNDWAFDYISDMLAPIINYMTRDIRRFMSLQCVAKSKSMTTLMFELFKKCYDNNAGDLEHESKVASIWLSSFIVSNKQVGNDINELLSPILTFIIPTLIKASTTKKKQLKVKIIEVILAMIYYDVNFTLNLFNNEPQVRDNILNILFESIPTMSSCYTRRLLVLAFCNILSLPSISLPNLFQANMRAVLQQIIREIILIEEEDAKEDSDDDSDEDEDDEDEDFDDEDGDILEEDEDLGDNIGRKHNKSSADDVPEGGFDEEEDCKNAEDEAYKIHLEKMEKRQRVKDELKRAGLDAADFDDGDFDDDDEDELVFTSPIENMDLVLYFMDALHFANTREPEVIGSLQNSLDMEDKNRLQEFFNSMNGRKLKTLRVDVQLS